MASSIAILDTSVFVTENNEQDGNPITGERKNPHSLKGEP
jgi:hypothetical protein